MRMFVSVINPALDALPVGTEVLLLDDHGDVHETRTRSEPWSIGPIGDKTWIVLVEGRTGGYSVERLRRVLK